MAFCVDSSAFIQAHQRYYPADLVPGFWDSLAAHAATGQVITIDEVRREIVHPGAQDQLAQWMQTHAAMLVKPNDDPATQLAMKRVDAAMAARVPPYVYASIESFRSGADPWLIAYCLAHQHILVTHEEPAPRSTTKVRIPDVALLVGVGTVTLFEMMRTLGIRLVSAPIRGPGTP
ncbi:MAG: DUF4411 family protein [Deltaproteobacteria bacterium]|nr:DUF4411 family protein [Deltaproteobacteria bacterium]